MDAGMNETMERFREHGGLIRLGEWFRPHPRSVELGEAMGRVVAIVGLDLGLAAADVIRRGVQRIWTGPLNLESTEEEPTPPEQRGGYHWPPRRQRSRWAASAALVSAMVAALVLEWWMLWR